LKIKKQFARLIGSEVVDLFANVFHSGSHAVDGSIEGAFCRAVSPARPLDRT
jgi:hypothetical protein